MWYVICVSTDIVLASEFNGLVFKLHASGKKPAEIQKELSTLTKQIIPIEAIRELVSGGRYLAERRIAREKFNDELFEENLASKRYRIRILDDLLADIKPSEFEDMKDYFLVKLKAIDLANKIMEKRGKGEDEFPDIEGALAKVHPYWQAKYVSGDIDYPKIIELIKTGKAYALPERTDTPVKP